MFRTGLLMLGTCLAAVATSGEANAAKWVCKATGLAEYRYDGGTTAMIRLQQFSSGGTYSVVKKGNVATGKTANGTSFRCTSSK